MQENQHFTTVDSVSVYGLLGVVVFIFASVLWTVIVDDRPRQAHDDVAKLASSLLEPSVAVVGLGKATRSIASEGASPNVKIDNEGRIGLDPWGRAYQYRVFADSKGRQVAVVISGGPNMLLDTSDDHFISDKDGAFVELANQNDDIVAIISK